MNDFMPLIRITFIFSKSLNHSFLLRDTVHNCFDVVYYIVENKNMIQFKIFIELKSATVYRHRKDKIHCVNL